MQNEINCMSDSKEFQDAESIRSRNSHVTSRPVSFPPHPILEGMLRPSFVVAAPQRRAAKHLGHTWYIGKRFCKSRCAIISTLSSRIESMEFIDRESRFVHPQWKRVKSKNKIKIRDASLDRQPKIQSSSVEETLQIILGQTNNDCRFRIFILTNSQHQPRLLAGR